jgi:hypothetical protein
MEALLSADCHRPGATSIFGVRDVLDQNNEAKRFPDLPSQPSI